MAYTKQKKQASFVFVLGVIAGTALMIVSVLRVAMDMGIIAKD